MNERVRQDKSSEKLYFIREIHMEIKDFGMKHHKTQDKNTRKGILILRFKFKEDKIGEYSRKNNQQVLEKFIAKISLTLR